MLVCWCTVSPYVQHPPFLALNVSNQCLTCEKRIDSKGPSSESLVLVRTKLALGAVVVPVTWRHPSLAFLTSAPL